MKKSVLIGPSTGWLYAIGIYSPAEQENIIRQTEANILEICTSIDEKRIEPLFKEKFGQFKYKSLHWGYESSMQVYKQLAIAKKLIKEQDVQIALIHPDGVPKDYYIKALVNDIPLAVENMDKNKKNGFKLTELEQLIKNFKINFVLDVQHAYEHDREMKYAENLFDIVKDTLVHLHVSGEIEDNCHALVHKSNNSSKIINFIGKILSEKNVPIILEGEYKNSAELNTEIIFLTLELGLNIDDNANLH